MKNITIKEIAPADFTEATVHMRTALDNFSELAPKLMHVAALANSTKFIVERIHDDGDIADEIYDLLTGNMNAINELYLESTIETLETALWNAWSCTEPLRKLETA